MQARNSMMLHSNIMKLRQVMKPSYPFTRRAFGANAESKVLFEHHSPSVLEFKLNSPKTLNAVDVDMCNIMIEELKNWRKNPEKEPRVLMLSGVGGKAFCAGGDVVNVYKSKMGLIPDKNVPRDFFAREYLLDFTLSQMRATRQISIWNGICMGGGVGLTWHSPVRVATDNSMYAMPETAIGFFCDVGGSYFLSRVRNEIELGLYIGLTGQRVKARDLVKWGIATHFVPKDKLPELYKAMTSTVTKESTDEQIDEIVNYFSDQKAAGEPIENYDEIKAIFKPDSTQAILDRLTASKSEFATKTLK